jgi:hypothetical protein
MSTKNVSMLIKLSDKNKIHPLSKVKTVNANCVKNPGTEIAVSVGNYQTGIPIVITLYP